MHKKKDARGLNDPSHRRLGPARRPRPGPGADRARGGAPAGAGGCGTRGADGPGRPRAPGRLQEQDIHYLMYCGKLRKIS